MGSGDSYAPREGSRLIRDFGAGIFDELRGQVVLDFGCGTGENAIELAKNGCRRVIGLDIQEQFLEKARFDAKTAGVADVCVFTSSWCEPVDVIVSQDAFEHFASPAQVLRVMRGLIKDSGYLLVEFGPPWRHPYGGHLFSVFPWAHLFFTERALIRWRTDFKSDGATRFQEVAGGLNRMTLRRWERLVSQSDFAFLTYEPVPIRPAKRFHCFLTREFLTSSIRARLTTRPGSPSNSAAC
jgi:SAM-dependent methyltransferase